jgi:hypothetical protein
MRRVRLHFTFVFSFVFGIYVPLHLGLSLSRSLPTMQLTLEIAMLTLVLLVFLERHRVTKELAVKLGISSTDASKIMSTPTWRTAAWQRGPAASLIRRASSPATTTNVRASDASTTLAESGDRPTV